MVATDEHDEDSILISDEFTNPHKRRKMVEKRGRKLRDITSDTPPPQLEGPEDAEVTLVGWGSTYGVVKEALELLKSEGRYCKPVTDQMDRSIPRRDSGPNPLSSDADNYR